MQFEVENEKVLIMNAPYTPLPNRSLLKTDPEIKRARTVLMVILGVSLVRNLPFEETHLNKLAFLLGGLCAEFNLWTVWKST